MRRMNQLSVSAVDRALIASIRLGFETEAVISAAKVDELKAKNPEIADAIQKLNDQLTLKKLPKYLPWGVKQLQAKEGVDAVLSALDEFENLLRKKRGVGEVDPITRKRASEPFLNGRERDIFFYKSLKDLTDKVEEAKQAVEERDVEEISKEEARKKIREEGVEYIYHDADFLVARPLTKKASCHYGMGTKWCISDPEMDYFERYSKDNKYFYFVIDRSKDASGLAKPDPNKPDAKVNDPWAKVAFVFQKGDPDFLQAWNTPDHQMPIGRVLSHYTKEYGRKIYELIHLMYKSVESLPNTWQYDVINSKDPNRLIELLDEQGKDNEDVRKAVAANSQIPAEVQVRLANDDSVEVRRVLAKNKALSSAAAVILSKDPYADVRVALANSVNLASESDPSKASEAALNLLNDESDLVVNNIISRVTDYYSDVPELFSLLLDSPHAKFLAKISRSVYKATTPEQLIKLISLNPSLASEAAGRDIANNDVILAALATGITNDWEVQRLMNRLKPTPEVLDALLNSANNMGVRESLASNEDSTPEVLDRIASAGPVSLKLANRLAGNPKSSPELLSSLLTMEGASSDGYVLLNLAGNANLPVDAIRTLAAKDVSAISPTMRLNLDSKLADNSNTPNDVLVEISNRNALGHGDLANDIVNNKNASPELLRSMAEMVKTINNSWNRERTLASIANNENCPDDLLRSIAEAAVASGASSSLIRQIAGNPRVPVDLLEKFASNFMYMAAKGLAGNPSSTPEILRMIYNYRKDDVRKHGDTLEEAIRNPNFPLDLLLETASKPGTRLGKYAKEVLKDRPDRPAPAKRTRKPKAAEPIMTPAEVEAHVHGLAEVMHLLKLPASVLLAMEEAADLLSE